ncbi:MAG: NADH-quinone oxidoreductase subunit L [Phycisphaerales bacterium]|nr:NADH-quinone oxidoreductase subunit L [Phycisphaerales bacterium]
MIPGPWAAAAWYATIPFWPLLGALLVGVLLILRQKPERAHLPVVAGVAFAALLAVIMFFDTAQRYPSKGGTEADHDAGHAAVVLAADPPSPIRSGNAPAGWVDPGYTYTLYRWISFGAVESQALGRWISVNFYFDGLTAMMMLFVTVVSLMVVIYAIGYMRDHHGHPERGYERFFAFLGLFVFSMAMLVMAGNFVLLYLGWELVGLCSYLLIGFYYGKPEAAAAAKKAFLVNRIGDLGFALGIFALYWFLSPHVLEHENPLDFAIAFKYAAELQTDSGLLGLHQSTVVALLLLCGAIGKSAQFPLYVWLPDAMEGPTPVSALIHAATMVTAGIYMIARCGPIFAGSPFALDVILILGLIGAVLTATMALAQYDMKRILAYSTISQLAFMFVALGCGVPKSGVFHVFTHAWFKALLFLGAGSVMHAMGGVIDVRRFSGLRQVLPRTYAVMLIGCLALAGFPLLAGFWSKDEIVHAALFSDTPWVGWLLVLTALLTAFYTFRMFFLCFHGPLRLPAEAGQHPHESPPVMLRPLYILALGAIFTGYLGVGLVPGSADAFLGVLKPHAGIFHAYLGNSTIIETAHQGAEAAGAAVEHGSGIWVAYLSAVVALAGIGLAWLVYGRAPEVDPARRALGSVFGLLNAKYYVDEIYDAVLVRPLRGLGKVLFGVDRLGVDGAVHFVAAVPRGLAFVLQMFQRGVLQSYALSMVLGLVVLLVLWTVIRSPAT